MRSQSEDTREARVKPEIQQDSTVVLTPALSEDLVRIKQIEQDRR
jgi:hypothetical protein